ncbi:DUF6328 family protein [Streptomyces sp. NPDC058247]|uniref:DUF6328 family protein n=1 Tax=Streptomyces sp. NPDC058247 TaxID=3346401 RepID=UPI0036E4742B
MASQEIDTQERTESSHLVAINEHTSPTKPSRSWVDESDHSTTIQDFPIVHSAVPLPATVEVRATAPGPAPGATSRSPKQQQRYAEILQEIRVAQTGVQFLLGFLMTLAFTPRFTELNAYKRDIYVTSLVLAFAAAALLTAPAPFHRLVTRRGLKHRLIKISRGLSNQRCNWGC